MKYKTFIKRERDTTEKDRKTEHTRDRPEQMFFSGACLGHSKKCCFKF